MDAEFVIKIGPAFGVVLVIATQRPDKASLPTGVSGNVSLPVLPQGHGPGRERHDPRHQRLQERDPGDHVPARDRRRASATWSAPGPAPQVVRTVLPGHERHRAGRDPRPAAARGSRDAHRCTPSARPRTPRGTCWPTWPPCSAPTPALPVGRARRPARPAVPRPVGRRHRRGTVGRVPRARRRRASTSGPAARRSRAAGPPTSRPRQVPGDPPPGRASATVPDLGAQPARRDRRDRGTRPGLRGRGQKASAATVAPW